MPTVEPLNGLSGNLHNNSTWAQQQTLAFIQKAVDASMASLTPDQRTQYIRLQREATDALQMVDQENQALIQQFKRTGLAQLRARLGDKDPEAFFIHTDYLEKIDHGMPWNPPRPTQALRVPRSALPSDRPSRALDETSYKRHTRSMTLWEAACLNFGVTRNILQDSGYSLVEASYISGPEADTDPVSVEAFIDIARDLDLGLQLKRTLGAAMGQGGRMRALLRTATQACLQFDLLESYRNRAHTGISQPLYEVAQRMVDNPTPHHGIDTISLGTDLFEFPFAGTESMPIPLAILTLDDNAGVLSYFPARPSGPWQHHENAAQAAADFMNQLRDGHDKRNLGWLSRQLALRDLARFNKLLAPSARPEGMNWLAELLYDGFHLLVEKRNLEHLRFKTDATPERPRTLLDTLTNHSLQRYHTNLSSMASVRSEVDWQAVKDAVAAIASEVMGVLLTPVPGGLTGVQRALQYIVMGSLSYSTLVGVSELAKGEPDTLASTLSDLIDMAISARLMSVAGRAQQLRINQHLMRLGNPQAVSLPNGEAMLWKPDLTPYAIPAQGLLDGQQTNAQGIYLLHGKTFAKLHNGERALVAQISYDEPNKRYTLVPRDGSSYQPTVTFDPSTQRWKLNPHDTHALDDVALLQRLLPDGDQAIPLGELAQTLKSTATPRATLDAVWQGEEAPLNLTEGVRRVQADRLIQRIISDLPQRGHMPAYSDSTVLALLTRLPDWPGNTRIDIYDPQGTLIEAYGEADAHQRIELRRREDETYVARHDPSEKTATREQLFELIVRQQPADSALGMAGLLARPLSARIVDIRQQIAALAESEQNLLFEALTLFAGQEKKHLPEAEGARRFLPLQAPRPLVEVTPLLSKLRALNPPLTVANLEVLLRQAPLNPRQQEEFLRGGTLPSSFKELIDHHRTVLQIDSAIDALYHPRQYNASQHQWAYEFASALILRQFKRPLLLTQVPDRSAFQPTAKDTTVIELCHYGAGHYEAYDSVLGRTLPTAAGPDSFYLALGSALHPRELAELGMSGANDSQTLRNVLGDLMSKQRGARGFINLLGRSLAQYERGVILPSDLRPTSRGIFEHQGHQYLPLLGSLYEITFDAAQRKWRLKHPSQAGIETPTLEHNNEGAWRLSSEDPMTWSDTQLFHRLSAQHNSFTDQTASDILAVTQTPARLLRQVHATQVPAPPLLADTSKRFRLEQETANFIDAMHNAFSLTNANPQMVLLLLPNLPNWPATHVLQLVDQDGAVLQQYPNADPARTHKLTVPEHQLSTPALLRATISSREMTQALLGELPASIEERMLKVAGKVAAAALREKSQLIDTLYERSEKNATELELKIKVRHPQLPNTLVKAVLAHATGRELKQLQDSNQVGLRLSEQIHRCGHDVRLNRAYEGLFREALSNADSEKITLHLLNALPNWPTSLRLQVRRASLDGEVLHTAGNPAAPTARVLVRRPEGYQVVDALGAALTPAPATGNNLLASILATLSASDRTALGLPAQQAEEALRQKIIDLALNRRVEIKSLLDLPHLQPWMRPAMPIESTFTVYPFWERLWPRRGQRAPDPVREVQRLFPRYTSQQARAFVEAQGLEPPALLLELERRSTEYHQMNVITNQWIDSPAANNLERADRYDRVQHGRRQVLEQLQRAWRRESEELYYAGEFDTPMLRLECRYNDLPPSTFIEGTRGFEHIQHLHITGGRPLANLGDFLSKFTSLHSLTLECALTELPTSITQMTGLTDLYLNHNQIRLDENAVQRLSTMTALRTLVLGYNPLGMTPDVSAMTRLQTLDLRSTGIRTWPEGSWLHASLLTQYLQDNQLTEVPDAVLNQATPLSVNTLMHGNPFSEQTLVRLGQYIERTHAPLNNDLAPVAHSPEAIDALSLWLEKVPPGEHTQRSELWQLLQVEVEGQPLAADTFRVLRDLTASAPFIGGDATRQAITARVWALLTAMGESTELRNNVFNSVYAGGTCGDGAILTFINMEIEARKFAAKNQSASAEADKQVLELCRSLFYLDQVDSIARTYIDRRLMTGVDPDTVDAAEIILYLRTELAAEFNLPPHPRDMMLYGTDITDVELAQARARLRTLQNTPAADESILLSELWREYLFLSANEPFSHIAATYRQRTQILDKEVTDKRSEGYLERRQSLIDEENMEKERQVRLYTEAALLRQQRVEGGSGSQAN